MIKYRLIVPLVFLSFQIIAQKANFGFKIDFSLNNYRVSDESFQNLAPFGESSSNGIGLGLLFDYNASSKFKVRFLPTVRTKTIKFLTKVPGIPSKDQDIFQLEFYSLDFDVLGLYKFNFREFYWTPEIGLNFSFNNYLNSLYGNKSSADVSAEFIFADITQGISYVDSKSYFTPGIIFGFIIGSKKLALNIRYVYTGTTFFREEIFVPFNSRIVQNNIDGKFQQLTIGIVYTFQKF